MHPDALGPTAPQHAHDPVALRPPPPSPPAPQLSLFGIFVLVAVIVALAIGVVIGRATSATTAVIATSPSVVGQLHVLSVPIDGNVVVDGRFAGVSPIERLDLDPGKHSVVIDAFGYQPYSGTVQIEPRGTLNLSVTLAALGVDVSTSGTFTGVGTAKHAVVPPSALIPANTPAPVASPPTRPARTSSAAAPPPRSAPRRDCDGEKSRCRDSCSHAATDCSFSCPGCSSCNTSTGWDECKRQCDTCRSGCEQNTKFCESSCDSQYGSCEASQP
jgi:PEGA domain